MSAIRLHPEMTPPRLDCLASTERFELLNPETRDWRLVLLPTRRLHDGGDRCWVGPAPCLSLKPGAHPVWSERLSCVLGGAMIADIAGVDLPVAGLAERRALHLKTGALAADTESLVAARAAAAHRLPFAAVRVVADPAHRQLPHAALVAIKPDGSLALGAILGSLVRDPRQIPQLMRTANDARLGFAALFRGRKMLDGTLGFSDFHEFLLDLPAEDELGGPLQV
jgi:adenosylhomocysteine nucleosidase